MTTVKRSPELVGTILKNRSDQVRVALSDYYGEPRVDLRIDFLDARIISQRSTAGADVMSHNNRGSSRA